MSHAATTVARIDVEGAYGFSNGDGLNVVFKTAEALPTRSGGGIRGSAVLDGKGPNSVGRLRSSRKAAHCYIFFAKPKNAKVGSKHELTVNARSTDGDVSDAATVKVTSKRDADAARKRLGC